MRTALWVTWAQLDFTADFALGVPSCPSDCQQPPDGYVDVEDILFMFANWGRQEGPFDVDYDGVVDVHDLLAVLAFWGPCQ